MRMLCRGIIAASSEANIEKTYGSFRLAPAAWHTVTQFVRARPAARGRASERPPTKPLRLSRHCHPLQARSWLGVRELVRADLFATEISVAACG